MSSQYRSPLGLAHLALAQAAEAAGASAIDGYEETLGAVAGAVLESAARFAGEVLSPLNRPGDRSPSRLEPGGVTTPPGFARAYRMFRDDGWVSLAAPADCGGQGLPMLLASAVTEMWAGANLSLAMCPELALGALEVLRAHAGPELIERYAARIASGEWTAAMDLTEPGAGSDLSLIRTRAERQDDAWRLYGRKMFISWGDHDLTENIVHFVLARTRGAPEGLKGLSLFLVPKNISARGGLEPNDIRALSVEHKMGIRASPTCLMALGERDGARGWLIGGVNDGLACMFTMMNHMRLGVGLHSLGLAERALQLARQYARERIQGHDAAGAPCAIIAHADVRRMLLTMKALVHASRCLAYNAAATLDVAHQSPDATVRTSAARRLDLLTPLVKAWCSDVAVEVASLGVQVHGGAGYLEESEVSQVYRDARIGPIFEGTNYIQAQDLLSRKVLRDGAVAFGELLEDIEHAARALAAANTHRLGPLREQLLEGAQRMRAAVASLIARAGAPDLIGATAWHFLHGLGVLAGGWQWALAGAKAAAQPPGAQSRAIMDTAAFYAAHLLPRVAMHCAVIEGGTDVLAAALTEDI
ncbi:MAG: acyl-CoA dehydrogenase [Steroidobacteraceae bacterium]